MFYILFAMSLINSALMLVVSISINYHKWFGEAIVNVFLWTQNMTNQLLEDSNLAKSSWIEWRWVLEEGKENQSS